MEHKTRASISAQFYYWKVHWVANASLNLFGGFHFVAMLSIDVVEIGA